MGETTPKKKGFCRATDLFLAIVMDKAWDEGRWKWIALQKEGKLKVNTSWQDEKWESLGKKKNLAIFL